MPESGLPGKIYSKAGPLNIFCPIPSIPENCGGDSPISNPPGTDFIRILRYRSFLLPTPLSSHRSCSMPHRNVFPSAENIFPLLRCRYLPSHPPSHALPPHILPPHVVPLHILPLQCPRGLRHSSAGLYADSCQSLLLSTAHGTALQCGSYTKGRCCLSAIIFL